MTHLSGGSHIGAIMSVADIIAVLYADVLKYDPQNTKSEKRDRFILSKGHAGAAIYAALAECGFFDVEELKHIMRMEVVYQDTYRIIFQELIFNRFFGTWIISRCRYGIRNKKDGKKKEYSLY